MAHFAEIDQSGIVKQVIVIDNDLMLDENQQEQESLGEEVCHEVLGIENSFVQTSYTNSQRRRYAALGYSFDNERNAFIAPKPFPSWVLNEETCAWEAPTPKPETGNWEWDEETLSWAESQFPI